MAPRMTGSELRKFVAPEFVFGPGAINLTGRYAENYGARKVLLVTDTNVAKAGWTEKAQKSLEEKSIPSVVFDSLTPNPKDHEIMAGVSVYEKEDCDLILAVGGGSPMDCAKGIGIVATNQKHILSFEGVDAIENPGPPLICVPTTAGTSADVSQFAIVNDTSRKVKIAIVSKFLIPDVALIDPETTLSMPPDLTASTGMDALVHAVEAYVSNASSPVTDLHALEAIRLVSSYLHQAYHQPQNLEARTQMMLASLFAGLAFSNASLGLVHAMAHSLGGMFDLAHGECNAILLEQVVELNFEAVPEKYQNIAKTLGISGKDQNMDQIRSSLVQNLIELRQKLGIHQRLGDLGVRRENLETLAVKAMKDPCCVTNPKILNQTDVISCYEKAL